MDLKALPHWLYNWFIKFGPEPDFFLDDFKSIFGQYSSVHPKHQNDSHHITNTLLFRFLGHQIPWIFHWSFTIGSKHNLFILFRNLFYKWWPKFEYSKILKEVKKDVDTFIEYNKWVEDEKKAKEYNEFENQEFKTPTLASLKKKFLNATKQDIKKKMMRALAS